MVIPPHETQRSGSPLEFEHGCAIKQERDRRPIAWYHRKGHGFIDVFMVQALQGPAPGSAKPWSMPRTRSTDRYLKAIIGASSRCGRLGRIVWRGNELNTELRMNEILNSR